jgi:hypothetical protein
VERVSILPKHVALGEYDRIGRDRDIR